jgi:hypothetical protein
MPGMRVAISLVMLLAAASVPATARAYECTLDAKSCLVAPRWASRIVPYTIESPPADSPITAEAWKKAVNDSFARWSAPACTDLQVEEQAASEHRIRIITQGWMKSPAQAASTHLAYDGVTGAIAVATIEVNAEHHAYSIGTCEPGTLDLETVLTHEIGHYIGFAHPCEFDGVNDFVTTAKGEVIPACPRDSCDQILSSTDKPEESTIMWPNASSCESSFHDLRGADVEAVCSTYPRGADPIPCAVLPDPHIANKAFACSSTDIGSGAFDPTTLALFALLGLVRLTSRRR